MGAKSVDWILYFILVIFIAIFIIILYSLVSSYISLTPCINEEKSKVDDLVRTYVEEIVIREQKMLSKKITFSSCVEWVFSPCNQSGICLRFKNGAVYCLNEMVIRRYYTSYYKVKIVDSRDKATTPSTLFFNTRGIMDINNKSTYFFNMCNGIIESQDVSFNVDEVSKHIINSIMIECNYSTQSNINIDTNKYCK